jgi:hypothetical protein
MNLTIMIDFVISKQKIVFLTINRYDYIAKVNSSSSYSDYIDRFLKQCFFQYLSIRQIK